MAKLPSNQFQPRKVVLVRPRKKPRFRWGIVLIPGVIFLALWCASGISVGFRWDDVMDALHVHNRERYTRLAMLGLVAVGVVSVAKLLQKDNPTDEEKKT